MANLNRVIVLISLLAVPGTIWATHNSAKSIEDRVAPIGSINFGSATKASIQTTTAATASSGGGAMDGPAVYASSCALCHDAGIAGAPATGKADDWAGRLDAGMEILIGHAINGFQGSKGVMPAKGGFAHLSDEEVSQAVYYMVEQLE